MKNINFLLLAMTAFLFSACDKAEDVPSYLYIKPFELATNYAAEGANTLKITEAWVYVNGDAIGAYKVPGEVPIPATGKVALIIYPGIRNNGSSVTPAIYVHYNRYDVVLDMEATKTDTITPKLTYTDNIKFAWLDDFEAQTSLSFNVDADSLNNFQTTKIGAKYGTTCGFFKVTDQSKTMSVTTRDAFKGVPSNQLVYLEVDYKGTANFRVSLAGNTNTSVGSKELESAQFRAKDEWNKAYISFRFRDYNPAEYPSYNFIFAAEIPKDENGKPLVSAAELRIDNIKLLYPK
jgi:hypothetical protein